MTVVDRRFQDDNEAHGDCPDRGTLNQLSGMLNYDIPVPSQPPAKPLVQNLADTAKGVLKGETIPSLSQAEDPAFKSSTLVDFEANIQLGVKGKMQIDTTEGGIHALPHHPNLPAPPPFWIFRVLPFLGVLLRTRS